MQLRDGRDQVSVVRPNGTTRVVLGTRQPLEDTRRADVTQYWGENHPAPRQAPPEVVEEPLPQRAQTILSYSVPPELRNELNGGNAETQPASRIASMGGVAVKIKLHI